MFRLNKLKSLKSGERFDFKFFNLQAIQVPKGWDRLYVSVSCVETGKTITKTGKGSVKSGRCQWTETLSESIWIPQNDSSNELQECLYKLVVAMGSVRSGILGEALVNLASYRSSKTAIPLSLPLKKCNHGTILQVKIQCLTLKEKLREKQSKDIFEDVNIDYDDMDSKSDVSDGSLNKSVGSSSSNHLDSLSQAGELLSRDFSFSASSSRHSVDSIDGSLSRENISPQNSLSNTVNNQIGRQDSTGSQSSFPYGSYSFNESSKSNHSSFNSKMSASQSSLQDKKDDFNQVPRSTPSSPLRKPGSRDLLEAAEDKIEKLRAEARMREQNAWKLMTDVDRLQKELSDQSNHLSSLEVELSESRQECDGLKQEIEHMKILLEEATVRQKSAENMESQAKEINNLHKELEDEAKFHRESNADLALQLKKTQDSNVELVSLLQELEDTIEKQKTEIANLLKMQSESNSVGHCSQGYENNGEIKPNKEISVMNMSKVSCVSDSLGYATEHKLGYLRAEDNTELQSLNLQESLKNSEDTIQSLEISLQEKVHEIEAKCSLKAQALVDSEAQWRDKLAVKEEEIINLGAKLSEAVKVDSTEIGGNLKEVEVLKKKIEELEKHCNELTNENLELLLKLKESRSDLPTQGASSSSLSNEVMENDSLFAIESAVSKLNSQICKLEEELNNKEMLIKELSSDHLQMQCTDLEKKCADLELQLQAFRDQKFLLNCEFCKNQPQAEKQETEITALHQDRKEMNTENHLANNLTDLKISQADDSFEMSKTLSKLYEEIHLCLANVKKQQNNLYFPANADCFSNIQISNATDPCSHQEQAAAILNSFTQLKDLFEAKVTEYEHKKKQIGEVKAGVANTDDIQMTCDFKKDTFSNYHQEESLQMKSKPETMDSGEKILEKISEMDQLTSENLLKKPEVEAQKNSQRQSEIQISDLQNEQRQSEGNMEVMLKEDILSSTCLDDHENETMLLNSNMMMSTCLDGSQEEKILLDSSMESHVSAENFLSKELSELNISKQEVEVHLSELEKENVHLSERICGLEAQLRYLTDERESSRLELQNSESRAISLQEEIRRLERELETQKGDQKQKLEGMRKKWLEAQRECEHLKVTNIKLQTTAENLIDECSLLQKSTIDLRKQNMDLNEHCVILEAELRESQKGFSGLFKIVEALEGKYSLMLAEVVSKEKALRLELDALLEDNKKQNGELLVEVSMLNQMYLEKAVEVENLQREVGHLTEYIKAPQDGKGRKASAAILEMSRLHADKAMLGATLQEVQGKLKLSETNLQNLETKSETKFSQLKDELTAYKHNQDILMADRENLLELLEDVKYNEEKHKSTMRGLELKLKTSTYARMQLEEEISSLRVQLQKTTLLQNEISSLKRSLNEVQFENQRLEISFQILNGDYEELKTEKVVFVRKVSALQRAVSELEDCKQSKVSLEEKVLRLEGDLAAREALGAHDAELKNELSQVKRTNAGLHRKIKCLQEENQKCFKELKGRKYAKLDSEKPSGASLHTAAESELSEVVVKPTYISSPVMGTDPKSKIQLLENEMAEALEANEMYKMQLKSLLLEQCEKNHCKDENKAAKENKGGPSSLEMELSDLQNRYFHLSLKCAEVESEREQLVLKLKAVSNGRS